MAAPLAAVAGGAVAARYAAFDPSVAFAVALALGVAACVCLATPATRAGRALCLAALFACGAARVALPPTPAPERVDRLVEGLDLGVPIRLAGWVRRPPTPLGDADQLVVEVERAFDGRRSIGGVAVIARRAREQAPLELRYGERIELLARLRVLRNYETPGAFDRVLFENRRGIFLRASVRPYTPIHRLEGEGGSRLEAWLWRARLELRSSFERLAANAADPQSAELVRAMTLGENRGVEPATRGSFERTGAYHVLVVSGLHVGLLAGLVIGLLRLLTAPRWAAGAAGAATAWAYALLLDTALPVTRAAAMLTLYLGATAVYRERNRLNAIAAAGLAFVVYDPALLWEVSFQMSFLSVAVIAGVAAPLLELTLAARGRELGAIWNLDLDLHLPAESAARRVAVRRWLDPLTRLLPAPRPLTTAVLLAPLKLALAAAAVALVSLVLTATLAAPLATHFQRIAGAAPLANLAATPLLAVIAPAGLLALLVESETLFAVAVEAAGALRTALELVQAAAPGLETRVPPPPLWLTALSGLACLWCMRALAPGGRRRAAALAAVGAAALVVAAHPVPPNIERGRLELTALDVGQGEALFLSLPEGVVGLVDAGGMPDYDGDGVIPYDIGERVVSPYLWSRSIRRLDFLAVTHPDIDHLGGAYAVMRNFRPRELWLPRGVFQEEFAAIVSLARSLGAEVRSIGPSDAFEFGGVRFSSLGAADDRLRRNDLSLVMLTRFGDHEFLLTGDLEGGGEARLATRLKAMRGEVLKVSHHGSRTSTIPELLDRFEPRVAVISAGYDNVYGHPHAQTLDRLSERGTEILRTDRDGLVSVVSNGTELRVARRIPLPSSREATAAAH